MGASLLSGCIPRHLTARCLPRCRLWVSRRTSGASQKRPVALAHEMISLLRGVRFRRRGKRAAETDRRLFRPHDCSDLGVDWAGWQGIGGEQVGTITTR